MPPIPIKLLLNHAGSYLQAIETNEVKVAGTKARYLAAGACDKPVLLFLHGLAGSKAQWRNMMNAFAADYRVLAPDVPGLCLHAPLLNAHHTLRRLMEWLDGFLAALGVENVHLIAHSSACPLAAVYAGSRERVQSIALITFPDVLAPAFSGKGQGYRKYREEIDFQCMEDWYAFFMRAFYQPVKVPTVIKRYNFNKFQQHKETFLQVVDDLTHHQSMVMPHLKRVDRKALVINADHDNFSDEEFHHMLRAHLPQGQHVTLENCGHMAFIDRYDEVVKLLKDFFLAGKSAGQAQ